MVRVSGISPPMAIHGFNNTVDTLERGVLERVFYVKQQGRFVPPPKPVNGHFARALGLAERRLRAALPSTVPLSRANFVDTFRGRKRRVYASAADDLLRRGFCPQDAHIRVFTKYEKTDFTRKSDPVPRVISPRSPRYNIELGRFLRPIEERIFRAIAKVFGDQTVFKGLNSADSGRLMFTKWSHFKDPVAVGLDASRFDQHVSREALNWEGSQYLQCFPLKRHRRRLAKLLSMQLVNECVGYTADGRVKYHTNGGRMSGDMNTSLGNCLLMCMMVFAYSHWVGVPVKLANNGDDCVVFMERRHYTRFMRFLDGWFLRMGFSMAVEPPCYTFEEIEFCQTHPVWVGPDHDSYIMVRHPKWAIAKDTVCAHNFVEPHLFSAWRYAVAEGGLSMTGGVPVFQNFYRAMSQGAVQRKSVDSGQSWGVRTLQKNMSRSFGDVLPRTRASFYWAFGVTPCEQLVLEDFYDNVVLSERIGSTLHYQPAQPL